MNTRSLYKKRNITKKSYKYFKDNITKYLSIDEQAKLPGVNDMLKYRHYPKKYKVFATFKSKNVDFYKKEIQKHYVDKEFTYNYEYPQIKIKYSKNENYKNFYMKKCKNYDILNINKMAKPFVYFDITDFQMNPSQTHLLFGVDFIGNRCYHLFIKGLFSNEIKELHIAKHRVVNTKQIFNNDSTISDSFTWLTDETIAYTAMDKYYNQKGVYVYNITNKSIHLLARIPHGYFGEVSTTSDNNYIVLNISDYNSDEIYIMDNEPNPRMGKPIFKRKFSVAYPFIDHDGEWIVHEQNKGVNKLKRTRDFKSYQIDYVNNNPNEQIIKTQYVDDTYIFTLCHLKGIDLYTIQCGKLKLVATEPDGFIKFDISSMDHFHYCKTFYLTPCHANQVSQYYEKKTYIKKDLFFTVLAKSRPTLSKCLLIGYGSYNVIDTPKYSPHLLALVLNGWTVVIAHLRGGGNYGYKGYNDGRLSNKKNTFHDFISIADYLVEHKFTTHNKLAIWGRSAGGLLISNVLNMRPDICNFAILGVPFVMPCETMVNYKNPLGLESRSEFSSSHIEDIDPIKHINLAHNYPNIFIYTNFYDTLVPFKEPLTYYNAIKEADVFKKDKEVNIYIDNKYGHLQGSSNESKIHTFSIIFDQLNKYIN